MHFLTTVAVEVPPTTEDYETDLEVRRKREKLLAELATVKEDGRKCFMECYLSELGNYLNAFGRAVAEAVAIRLEPYCESVNDPEYGEFDDRTEEFRNDYETNRFDCILMPNGQIVEYWDKSFADKFVVENDIVYEKEWGPQRTRKRTKKAKRIKLLHDYPVKKRYKSFADYALKQCGALYDEESGGYGYYFNYNAFWDWYQIGGRWPQTFIVKEDCMEYSIGNIGDVKILADCPKGYKWTSAARKKDIQWDIMLKVLRQLEIARYEKCKSYFEAGAAPSDSWFRVTETGVYNWSEKAVYLKGETLDENLKRRGLTDDVSYFLLPAYYVNGDGWSTMDSFGSDDKERSSQWLQELKNFYENLADDTVLVTVDIHQ